MDEAKNKENLNKRIQKIEQKEAKRVEKQIAKREQRFSKMLDNQMNMLEKFYETSNKKTKDRLSSGLQNQQTILEDNLSDMKREFNLYAKYMDNSTRKYYKGMISVADENLQTMKDTVSKRFGEMTDDIEDEIVGMTDSISDRVKRFTKDIRDAAIALELTDVADNVKSQLTDITDSFIDNFRERSAMYNGNITKGSYQKMIGSVVDSSYAMSRSEASELVNSVMDEMSMKTGEQLEPYLKEISALHTSIDANINDMTGIMRADINSGARGAIFKSISNIATGLGSDTNLTVDSNAMLSSMNEHIEDLFNLSKGDSKKFTGMTKSLATMEGIQQQEYNKGVEEAGGKIVEWSKMSVPELLKDDDFVHFTALSGMTAQDFRDNIDSGNADKVMMAMQDTLKDVKNDQFALNQRREMLGFSSDAVAMALADEDSLADNLKKVTDNINANADKTGSNAESMAGKSTGFVEKIGNWLSDSFPVRLVSDFFSQLDVKAANLANYAIIAYTAANAWGNVKGYFNSFKGISKGFKGMGTFFEKGGLKRIFSSKGALSGAIESGLSSVFGKTGGFFSKVFDGFKGVFSWVGRVFYANAPEGIIKALSKVGSKLWKPFSDFFGTIFSKIGSSGIGKLFGKLFGGGIFKVLGRFIPIIGGFFDVILDFFDGLNNVDKWFGENHNLFDTIMSGLIGSIFGTGGGVQGKNFMDDFLTILVGVLKGGAAGFAVGGPMGALAGAIIGGIANAIGGDRIANAFNDFKDRIIGIFEGVFDALHDLVADSWVGKLFGMEKTNPDATTSDNLGTIFKGGLELNPFLAPAMAVYNKMTTPIDDSDIGSHADGLSNVPYDNYLAYLHKGEAVLTANQAGAVRSDGGIDVGNSGSLINALGLNGEIGQGRSVFEKVLRGVFGITGEDTYGVGGLFGTILKNLFNIGSDGIGGLFGGGSLLDKLKSLIGGSDSSSGGGKGAPMSTGKGDSKKVWDFLAGKGFSANAIAGIMGNLQEESGFRSGAIEGDMGKTNEDLLKQITASKDAFLAHQGGFGLAQWTSDNRKSDLWDYAQSKGKSVADYDTQLEFLFKELKENYSDTYDALMNGSISLEEACTVFGDKYEGFGANSAANRLANAKQVYQDSTATAGGGKPQYAQGTPWVPDTQVALIHEGEMVVPADVNPLNTTTSTTTVSDEDGSENVVDAIKWQVSRLEAKFDILINILSGGSSSTRGVSGSTSVDNLLRV